MSPQQELLSLSPPPPTPHMHTLPARNHFWPRQGDTELRVSLETRELEQKQHPMGLPGVLELLPVFFALARCPLTCTGCWNIPVAGR